MQHLAIKHYYVRIFYYININMRLINLIIIKDEKRLPWAGAAVGIVLGIIIVIADQLLTKSPTIKVIFMLFP